MHLHLHARLCVPMPNTWGPRWGLHAACGVPCMWVQAVRTMVDGPAMPGICMPLPPASAIEAALGSA